MRATSSGSTSLQPTSRTSSRSCRFLGLIDEDGNRVEDKTAYFFGNDDGFKTGLEGTLRSAYPQVFDEMGDAALDAQRGDLAHWFRASDKTSDLVGQRQASTFQTLAALAGHGELPPARTIGVAKKTAAASGPAKKATAKKAPPANPATSTAQAEPRAGDGAGQVKIQTPAGPGVGLTVRIEVNLPPGGDSDTYDAIFASIRKHLMS